MNRHDSRLPCVKGHSTAIAEGYTLDPMETRGARRHLLLVSADHTRFTRFVPVLQRAGLEVQRVLRASAALKVAATVDFDLLLVVAPVEDMELSRYLAAVRAPDSPCRQAGVIVLTDPGDLDRSRALLGEGANRVLRIDCDDQVLVDTVNALLWIAPRRRVHAVLRADLAMGQRRRLVMHQTENLSVSGALVRAEPPYPVGTRFSFEITLPGLAGPIRGTAEVVRHTHWPREPIRGFGVSFLSFAGEGRQALEILLDRAESG